MPARIAKLKRDFDVLSGLREERKIWIEDAFARLRADAKFFDKARVQQFYCSSSTTCASVALSSAGIR